MMLIGVKRDLSIAFCLGDGCGVGNFVQALPTLQALHESGNRVDLFVSSFLYSDMTELVKGQPYIRSLYENNYEGTKEMYDVCIVSFLSDHRVANAKKHLKIRTTWKKRS